jgi:hypothetical protein
VFAILEFPDGPALSVGYCSLSSAEAALGRLLATDTAYGDHVVVETFHEGDMG